MRMNNEPAVYNLNRYVDVIPYDDTRVILRDMGDDPQESYINADYVHSPANNKDRKIIASQGPRDNTTSHFWRMIVQENVTFIVTVCKLEESGIPKCHKYWPEEDSQVEPEIKSLLKTGM